MKLPRLEVTPAAAVFFPLWFYLDRTGCFSAAVPAIMFHETGHLLAYRLTGAELRTLRLDAFGLCMDVSAAGPRWKELLCLAAGPAAGLLWPPVALHVNGAWWELSAGVGLMWNLFNLLPAIPLDGGHLLLVLTGNILAVTIASVCLAALLFAASMSVRSVLPLFPAALILFSWLIPAFPGAVPWPFAPIGRSAPGKRPGSWHSRTE